MKLAELESIVTGLKNGGLDTESVKRTLASILDAQGVKWDDKLDVPKFGEDGTTVVETIPTAIKDIVNDRLTDKKETDPSEDWEKAKAEALPKIKSKEAIDKVEADRAAALPGHQAEYTEAQKRVNQNGPITAGVASNGTDALFADLDKAKAKGLIQWVKNNVNLLTGNQNDKEHRAVALDKLKTMAKAKEAGKSFTEALKDMFTAEELTGLAQERKGKGVKELFDSLQKTFNTDDFGKNARVLANLTSKERHTENALARNEERLAEALQDKETGGKENKSATHKGWLRGEYGGTAFDKATSDGTELSAALKSYMLNAANAIDKGHGDLLNKATNMATAAQHSVDDWVKYFNEHPEARFRNTANANTVNKKVLLLTQYDKDNTGGKKITLAREADVENFLKALQQADKRPEIITDYTNLYSKSTDATEDTNRNQKVLDRYKQMFSTGDSRIVFQDPSVKKLIDRDENGFVTETDRDKKQHKSGYSIDDNYFKHLASIFNNSSPEELMDWYRFGDKIHDDNSIAMQLHMLKELGEDSSNKATQLGKDVIDFMYGIDNKDLAKDTGVNIDKGLFNESALRSMSHKLNKLKELNPNKTISGILQGGNFGDVFGKIHPKYASEKLPLIKAFIKLNNYDKAKDKNVIDLGELRGDLDANISAIQNAIKANDFSTVSDGSMTPEYAQEVLDKLKTARQFLSTNKEIENDISKDLGLSGRDSGLTDVSSLKSLADEDPDYYDKVLSDLTDAALELRAAKQANADFDVLNILRKRVEELHHEKENLENTKVDIQKKAEKSGRHYQDVLDEYKHSSRNGWYKNDEGEWERDEDGWLSGDAEDIVDKLLAKYDKMDSLKELASGQNINNKNVKYGAIEEVLDKLSGINPKLDNWKTKLHDYAAPLPKSQLLASQQASKDVLGLTPEEWSAWVNNNELFKGDTAQKRKNTARIGYKSKAGAYGADKDFSELAKRTDDFLNTPAQKEEYFKEVAAKNDESAKPYTGHIKAKDRLDNAHDTLASVIDALNGMM